MKRIFKYGFFQGMDPICPERLRQYPELEYVRDLTPEQLKTANREDLIDAQHQWAYSTHLRFFQECFEEGCTAVRPVPLDAYPTEARNFILRSFIEHNL